MIQLSTLKLNEDNPRTIDDDGFEKTKESILNFPQMLELSPIVVDENNVILRGNMRTRALASLGYTEVPESWVKVAIGYTEEQKKEFVIKDNVHYGSWDWESLANNWDEKQLVEWGVKSEWKKSDQFEQKSESAPKKPNTAVCPNCNHEFNPNQ